MGINNGKTRRNWVIGIGFVIVALVVMTAFVFASDNLFGDEPKAAATTATKPVYPERGYTVNVINHKGTLSCDTDVVASTKLADSGGTVSVNSLLVSSEWTSDGVTVTFDKAPPFTSGYVVGSNTTEPFNMPKLGPNEVLNGITLATKDFSESGKFQDIILCGGGL